MKKILTTISILLLSLLLVSCNHYEASNIMTTNFITYDFTRAIVGDHKSIEVLTPLGKDFHHFEPTSGDLVQLKKVDVLIYLGNDYETWLGDDVIATYLKSGSSAISLAALVENEAEHDHEDHVHGVHFWTDPLVVYELIMKLTDELSQIYPEYEALFHENGAAYAASILSVAESFKESIQDFNLKVYYVGHYALHGFESYFDITVIPLINSTNPSSDPTSQDLLTFVEWLKNDQVTIIFKEELKSDAQIDYLKEQIEGLLVYELHGYHHLSQSDIENEVTYLDLLTRNIAYLNEVLNDE